ncbi:hypothetical protein [Sorangium cellulosum]|uniref:hypothetical protein n=1 Tax=Sorangium cellulosum TaxID=56 RepID=UPI0013EBACD0|nr:hypothetical protein [Sorangium cellulosum]
MGREMRPSLPFICKSCRTKSKPSVVDRGGGAGGGGAGGGGAGRERADEPRSASSLASGLASERAGREPSSAPGRAGSPSGRASARDPGASSGPEEAGRSPSGAPGPRASEPAGEPERGAASAPARRRPALTLAERIALQELEELRASQEPERQAHPLDSLDAAAEASLEHAVVTPDGGLGSREGHRRSSTFAGAPREGARRASSMSFPAVGRSPSALPPADSDPVSIQDLAQMLSPGVEPPSFSRRADAAGDERASHPAPVPEAVAAPRAGAQAKVPVRPPARREHRTATAAARQRPVQRASGSPRPAAAPSEMPPSPLSEMPPSPLSEMPPAPLSSDESRPSSPRSAPELRLQDVQAMAALAPIPQPAPSARRTRAGLGALQPEGASPADLALLESLVPPSTPVPPPHPGPPPHPASPRAAEEPRRERARPPAAEAQPAAGERWEQGSGDRPSREPAERTSGVVRAARAAGDRASQTDLHARAGRKEDSGLIDLRSMSQPPGAEDGERRGGGVRADRVDEEILSISGGLFEGAAPRSSSPMLAMPSDDPDHLAQEGHSSPGDEAPVETPSRTSMTAGSLVSGGLRALSAQAWRQHAAVVGWVLAVFVVFGAALYFTMSRGRSQGAATAQVDPATGGALAAAPPEPDEAPSPAAGAAPAEDAADREPSLDDEPIEDPPATDPDGAEQAPAASAADLPGEQAAPPTPDPAQGGAAPAPSAAPAAPAPSAAPAAPAPSAAPAAPAPGQESAAAPPSAAPAAAPPSAAPAAAPPSAAPVASASPDAGEKKPEAPAKPADTSAQRAPDRPKTAAKAPPPPPAPLLPVRDEPARFDTSAASSALASAAAVAAGCPGNGLTGTARVAVTFSPSGKTMAARVEGGDLVGTPVAGCIAGAFRNLTVPPFEGIPVTVMKQVKIR